MLLRSSPFSDNDLSNVRVLCWRRDGSLSWTLGIHVGKPISRFDKKKPTARKQELKNWNLKKDWTSLKSIHHRCTFSIKNQFITSDNEKNTQWLLPFSWIELTRKMTSKYIISTQLPTEVIIIFYRSSLLITIAARRQCCHIESCHVVVSHSKGMMSYCNDIFRIIFLIVVSLCFHLWWCLQGTRVYQTKINTHSQT